MRQIKTHQVNGLNEAIIINAVDAPGAGGAHHLYELALATSLEPHQPPHSMQWHWIHFQKGPILENGINGISNEALLAVVIDRLECFQRGAFACKDNKDALGMIKGGLTCLQKRTKARVAQGVEGRNIQHQEPPASNAAAPTPFLWSAVNSDEIAGLFDTPEAAEADAQDAANERQEKMEIQIFNSRPATEADRDLFDESEAVDVNKPDWWKNQFVPMDVVFTRTVTPVAKQVDTAAAPDASAEPLRE